MNPLITQLLSQRHLEYLTLNQDLLILETSSQVKLFADHPQEIVLGNDVRRGFPELVGVEKNLHAMIQGEEKQFEIKGIARCSEENPLLYFDLYVIPDQEGGTLEHKLILLLEDVTEKMVMQQSLVQAANEANLLLSALAASKDYIAKIITSMADTLFVTNVSGVIKTVNPAAQDLLGYTEAELIGQPIGFILPHEQLSRPSSHLNLLSQNKFPKDIEVVCRKKTGEDRIIAFSCSPIQTDIKGLYDFVYLGRDITLRKQEAENLRKALAKEQELRELKSRFLSMVSHEFGNPLNTVLFAVGLLQEQGQELSEPEKEQYISYIKKAAKNMSHLLDDLRLIRQTEDVEILEFKPEPIDLVQFCSELVEEVRLNPESLHRVNFVYYHNSGKVGNLPSESSPNVEIVEVDTKILRHILTNLLGNAIKYSPDGSVIDFEVRRQEQGTTFQVRDKGIGIPPEDQDKLFQSFYRAKNVGKIPGTGLGLAIVKHCVDLHGGIITVDSQIGVGTTFNVTIPCKKLPNFS